MSNAIHERSFAVAWLYHLAARPPGAVVQHMNCLMVAFGFVLPYHVLRTATAAGHRVHVLGSGQARGLRWSRHCASYREARGGPTADLADDIRQVVRERDIDMILPSEDVSTRLLAELQDDSPAPTSLVPEVSTFDLLNNKWRFGQFCLDYGVRVPQSWLYRDAAALDDALASGRLELPLTVKPLSCSAGFGVVHLCNAADLPLLDGIDYRPVLVQRHILGETVGFNVVCRDGEILASTAQRRDLRRFELFSHADLRQNVERLVAATRYTGPANFDAVIEDGSGLAYIVECNPRFWYTIYMSMLVGINFVDVALRKQPSPAAPTGHVRLSLGEILRHPVTASRLDRHMLRYHLGDPLPFVFQRRRIFTDNPLGIAASETYPEEPYQAMPVAACGGAELVS